jgi:transcriptional regulator with XRE-family HTH domain/tetratricopeptide (TPR) repeat protein
VDARAPRPSPGTAAPGSPFGALLRQARLASGLTQEELAERAGLSSRSLRDLEQGRVRRPRRETLRLLGDALGLTGEARRRVEEAARAPLPGAAPEDPDDGVPLLPPAQLPPSVPGFVAREDELAALWALVDAAATDASPVAVVSGMPGAGKTAVVVHWARLAAPRFPDGQLFADLHGWSPEDDVPPLAVLGRFLRALGTPAREVPGELAEASALFRSRTAGRRVLVVLDDARAAEYVRPLLPGGPGCLVVVTSRDRLAGLVARDGAVTVPLGPLSTPDAVRVLEHVVGAERVGRERAAAVDLSGLCDHLPLALRIVAGRLLLEPHRSLSSFAAELGTADRLRHLQIEGDEGAGVARAFELSYQALPVAARLVLRGLGVLPLSRVTVGAAAAVAALGADEAGEALRRLASAHLVQPASSGYVLHGLVRAFAEDRCHRELSGEERAAARDRLLDDWLETVSAAAAPVGSDPLRRPAPHRSPRGHGYTPAQAEEALAWLDARADEVAVVVRAAREALHPAAWLVPEALLGYIRLRPQAAGWDGVLADALAAAQVVGDLTGASSAELGLGQRALYRDQAAAMVRHSRRALSLADEAGWGRGRAVALRQLGGAYRLTGNFESAVRLLREAALVHRRENMPVGEAACEHILGLVAHERGNLALALEHYLRALALLELTPAPAVLALLLVDLGDVYRMSGELGSARQTLHRALRLSREVGHRSQVAYVLRCIAETDRDLGDHESAALHARQGLVLAVEADDVRVTAQNQQTLATVHHAAGRLDDARAGYEQALVDARAAGNGYGEVECLLGLAAVRLALGDVAEALDVAGAADEQARRSGFAALAVQAGALLDEIAGTARWASSG